MCSLRRLHFGKSGNLGEPQIRVWKTAPFWHSHGPKKLAVHRDLSVEFIGGWLLFERPMLKHIRLRDRVFRLPKLQAPCASRLFIPACDEPRPNPECAESTVAFSPLPLTKIQPIAYNVSAAP